MRLQNKLLIGFSIVTFLLIVRGIQGSGFAELLRDDAERLADQITPSLGLLQDIEIHKARIIEEAFSGSAQLVLGNTDQAASEAEEMEASRALLTEAVTAFSAMPHHAGIADEIAEFNRLSDEMYAAALVMLEPIDRDSVLEALETLETTSEGMTVLLDQWLEHETGELNAASTTIVRVARQVLTGGNVSSVLLVIVVAITGFVFYRTVVRPMTLLEETARHIADGDYTHRVKVTQHDEIGQVMVAFNTMAASVEKRDGQLNTLNKELNTRFEEAQTARERAERSDRVKSAFLASMSHELRTPLNSILNFTKFIMKGVMGPVTDRQTDSLTKILNASKHLLNLINDVLDMSKIESDSLTLFVEDDVNVRELLNMAVETAQGLLEDKPIEIKQTVPAELPLIRGDKQRILQILLNILSNACKFTEQGQIDIRVENENNELHIAIKDSGVGIAPEDLALVFEPFKQTDSGLRQGGGTGLGMPISRSLAEAHQGKLWLESTAGAGTTVHVTLPVRSEALTPIEA